MKNKSTATVIFALLLASMGFAFSGCQTTEGVGRDLENAGEEIQEEARDARR